MIADAWRGAYEILTAILMLGMVGAVLIACFLGLAWASDAVRRFK